MDNVISNQFSVSNGIKQGGIRSHKLFNIYVTVLNISLNEKYLSFWLKDKVVNCLYYAVDLILVSPTASGMNELIQEKSFSIEHGLSIVKTKMLCCTLNLTISKYIHVLRQKLMAL